MYFDHPLAEEELSRSIQQNVCNRNSELASLIKILNYASDKSPIISLDGEWGSGKTFLIKQLEYLWKRDDNPLSNFAVSDANLNFMRNRLIPIYYNAWENDYALDAAQSLLLSLSESIDNNKNIISKTGRNLVECIDILSYIKEITSDLINIDALRSGKKIADFAQEVNRSKRLREAISSLINEKLQLQKDCKLLFIIDDLDRCKPSFALNLIETIKNNFNNERVMFLVATNFSELGNIVRGYYGGYIDGHRYLDRIFDLKLSLNRIDQNSYIKYKCPEMNAWAIRDVATNLKLNMRELNRLLTIVNIYDAYFKSEDYFVRDRCFYNICRYIFIPLFVGYRIKKYPTYEDLISHNGEKHIAQYFIDSKSMESYAKSLLAKRERPSEEPISVDVAIEKYYDMLFSNKEDEKAESNAYFWDILNLTSDMLNLSE